MNAPAPSELTRTGPVGSASVQTARHIVCIGASAGGLEPIELIFRNMPQDSGCAFVVVQHLSPDFRSLMDQLLSRQTQMEIIRVEDGMPIQPDRVYLIPPRKQMIVSDGQLLLRDNESDGTGPPLPINIFMRSLADSMGHRCTAVVLSGTGSDGSLGAARVNEVGGLVIVQDPATAAFDSMPCSALSLVPKALVLAPEVIPQAIMKHVRGEATAAPPSEQPPGIDDPLGRILAQLGQHFSIDFRQYKLSTVGRRISRRAELRGISDLLAYAELVETDREELEKIYGDLLINTTVFFRDPEVFAALEESVLTELWDTPRDGKALRIWVPACATGEEAYSIAILLREFGERRKNHLEFNIFATDVHRRSLEFASKGHYPSDRMQGLDGPLLERYFIYQEGGYKIRPEIRRTVVFSPQDALKDPPFTRMDLVSCRNFLIYLKPEAQRTVLGRLSFALRKDGFLLLGSSETLGDLESDLETVSPRARIFQKRREARHVRLPDALALPQRVRSTLSAGLAERPHTAEGHLRQGYESLMNFLVPSGLLIDEAGLLLHVFGDAAQRLSLRTGAFRSHVQDLVGSKLRRAIASGMHKSRLRGERVLIRSVPSESEGEVQAGLDLIVTPLTSPIGNGWTQAGFYLITFEDPTAPPPMLQVEAAMHDLDYEHRIRELERDLQTTEENLQTTIEELQASNEELMASNEELQSTNEELHSVNEELHTVSAEHQARLDELLQLTNDMENLLRSSDIGIVFLDERLQVRRYTPPATKLFALVRHDLGRPLREIRWWFEDQGLEADLQRCLAGQPPELRELRTQEGRHYRLRILPYRTVANDMEGVVLTFHDITDVLPERRPGLQVAS